jgi:hypothetical protein
MTPRKTIAALVSLLTLAVCASTASADPLSMTFTEARANVGVQLTDAALFEAPDTAPFSAQIDPATGAISNGTLGVPDFETHIEEPIVADVTVDFDIGEITGSFDQTTGDLSLSGVAAGTLTATSGTYEGEACSVLAEPLPPPVIPPLPPLTLSTAGTTGGDNPRSGVPFTAGLAGFGAIAGEWENMSAKPVEPGNPDNVSFCNNVENRIGGPGGIWLEQEGSVTPPVQQPTGNNPTGNPPPPPPPACIVPKLARKSLKQAKAELRAANCTVGKVRKPKHRKGKRLSPLIVKSSKPPAGTTLAAGSKVNLKVGRAPNR